MLVQGQVQNADYVVALHQAPGPRSTHSKCQNKSCLHKPTDNNYDVKSPTSAIKV